jgi:hypothetical protein
MPARLYLRRSRSGIRVQPATRRRIVFDYRQASHGPRSWTSTRLSRTARGVLARVTT